MLDRSSRRSHRPSRSPWRLAHAALLVVLGLAVVSVASLTQAAPGPAKCDDKPNKADHFDWREAVTRNEKQLRADTKLLARAVAALIRDQRAAGAADVIRDLARRREACQVVNDTLSCDFDVTMAQLSAGFAARGQDLRKLLVAALAASPVPAGGEPVDPARIEAIVPVIELDGVRIDPFIRVVTLDTSFYPKAPALPTVVLAGQLEPGGKEAIGYGDLDGDGLIEATAITRANFPNHVLWAVGLNVTNRELPDQGPAADVLRTPLANCHKRPSGEGGGCRCQTSLPHFCGSRCFLGCWGGD